MALERLFWRSDLCFEAFQITVDIFSNSFSVIVSKQDLKNAKSIVDWIAWAEPQYDFNPMIDEWCKEAPRELDFNIEAGMFHLHR